MRDFMDVLQFHKRFDLPCSEFTSANDREVFRFRLDFLNEEVLEYHGAYGQGNLVAVVDALIDFVYVAIGTAFFIGTPRQGPRSIWPSYRTSRTMMLSQNIIDEELTPHLINPGLHHFTANSLRCRVEQFKNAWEAAFDGEEGAAELAIQSLKDACDEAYKTASMIHVPWDQCWYHVQEANMKKRRAKMDGSDSKRASQWDVVKPNGWKSPDAGIASELMLAGWRPPAEMNIDNVTGRVEINFVG